MFQQCILEVLFASVTVWNTIWNPNLTSFDVFEGVTMSLHGVTSEIFPWFVRYTQYFYDRVYPGRNRIYPPGLVTHNVPGILFLSQYCHYYVSTPGETVICVVTPLFSDESVTFCFLEKENLKKNLKNL